MSEAPDQPGAAETPVVDAPNGVDAPAPADTNDDIDTEAFDRMEVPDDDDAGAGDGQPDADADADQPSGDADEIEFETDDGTKLKVPKALEAHLMRDKDYRQKTQAVADQRRELETKATELAAQADQQAQSLVELRAEHLTVQNYESGIAQIDAQLANFAKITPDEWATLRQQEPENYDAHLERYKELQGMRTITADAVEAAKTDLKAKETSLTEKRTAAQEAKLNDNWKQANEVLKTKIEGWSADKFREIGAFAMKEFGVSADDLRQAADPVAWTMANRLMKAEAELATLKATQKQAKATETALKPQAVTPAVKPAGGGAKPSGVSDGLSTEEWLRRRNAQIARKAAAR